MVNYTLKEKILKFLIENKEETNSIRKISQSIVADYKNTYNAIKELQPEIVLQEKIGNTNSIKLKFGASKEIMNVEEKRTEEFLDKNPSSKIVKTYTENQNYPFLIVLVFGSYVKKTKTEKSDVDLCIISDNNKEISKLREKLGILSLNLEIQEFSTSEFISMIEKKQSNLGHEIIKKNILLYGKENYYNLISKWMKKE
jgi:predicted nucleotidyltransferase